MKKNIILMIKGFVFGIANIIPGVSGGTLAMTMGIYEDMINSISHIFSNLKKNLLFLLPIGVGAVISILLMSKLINRCLENYPFPTTLFFIGLILGGVPLIARKVKDKEKKPVNFLFFLLTFSLVAVMAFMSEGDFSVSLSNPSIFMYFLLFLVGMVAAATMVIPGVSGSFVLMLIGFYKPIVKVVSDLTNINHLMNNLLILIPFGIGVVVGIILVAKLIEFLLKRFETTTYYAILGFVFASFIGLVKSIVGVDITTIQLLIGIVLFLVASFIGYKLGDE